jgi:hypothetical protein
VKTGWEGVGPADSYSADGTGEVSKDYPQVVDTRPINLYRTMDMAFWLPEAMATLAQVEGR